MWTGGRFQADAQRSHSTSRRREASDTLFFVTRAREMCFAGSHSTRLRSPAVTPLTRLLPVAVDGTRETLAWGSRLGNTPDGRCHSCPPHHNHTRARVPSPPIETERRLPRPSSPRLALRLAARLSSSLAARLVARIATPHVGLPSRHLSCSFSTSALSGTVQWPRRPSERFNQNCV